MIEVTFKNRDDAILAVGYCNYVAPFKASYFIPVVKAGLVNARTTHYLFNGGEYDEYIFKTFENYQTLKENVEKSNLNVEILQEKYGQQYFSKDWHKNWHAVEVFSVSILRTDLIKATSDALYEEEFVKNLSKVYRTLNKT